MTILSFSYKIFWCTRLWFDILKQPKQFAIFWIFLQLITGVLQQNNKLQEDSSKKFDKKVSRPLIIYYKSEVALISLNTKNSPPSLIAILESWQIYLK